MFNNVIVGVDGSKGGRDAIALAAQLAHPDATVTLANVYAGMYMPSHAITPGRVREDRQAAEKLLTEERSEHAPEAQTVVKQSSSPARGLRELAEETHADLLVLGSCHRGAFGRAMLGNDARAGLNGAPCAVAVASHGYTAEGTPFTSIGVGYNATAESKVALAAARELASRTGARIKVLRIVTQPTYLFTGILPPAGIGVDELVKAAEAEMGTLEDVETKVQYGAIDVGLEQFSNEVDLLIVGSRAYGPAMRLIAGSTSRFLLGHSRAPLLVLPRGATTSQTDTPEIGATSQNPVPV